jgi:GNAT superfamily N-acetyltransferase
MSSGAEQPVERRRSAHETTARARTHETNAQETEIPVETVVRPATIDDLSIVVAFRLALLHEHAEHPIYGTLHPEAESRALRLFAEQLGADNEASFLAWHGGRCVGMLRCSHAFGSALLLPSAYGYVSSVYVVPEARRQGVLRTLIDAADAWCRERGLTQLRLHNAIGNHNAAAAWGALGFEPVEQLRVRRIRR